MDTTLLVILTGGGVLLLGVVWFMLRQSWGDFPQQPDYRSLYQPQPDQPPRQPTPSPLFTEAPEEEAGPFTDDPPDPAFDAPPVAPEHADFLLIHHPMLLQVIEQAEREQRQLASYIVREEEHVYLSLHMIRSPVERRQAVEMIEAYQSGNHVGVWDMITLMNLIGRSIRK